MAENNENTKPKLIINYLPQEIPHEAFQQLFESVGVVESCKIMKDYKTGYSYGFGFVTYHSPEDAEKAIKQLNGFEMGHKRIKVSYARPSGETIKETNLYITNLPSFVGEDKLDCIFGKFGTIVQKHLLVDKETGNSRGVAFVRYATKEEAYRARSELNGQKLPGCREPLSVKVAEDHGKQRAAYYLGMNPAANMFIPQQRLLNAFAPRGRVHFAGRPPRNFNSAGSNTFNDYEDY